MRRFAIPLLVLISLALGRTVAAPAKPATSGNVKAVLELNQEFYYVGEPLNMRITISNGGAAEVPNPVRSPILGSVTVSDSAGRKLEPQGKTDAKEPARPSKLASKAFYGAVVDLTEIYPQVKSRGKYTVKWAADGVASDEIVVAVIPRFDPSKDYVARVQTEEGTFVIDLLKRTAPIAVKAFVDMANAGFYDGLLLHEVRSDQVVSGGDPTGTGGGQAPFRYPAELSAIPIVSGSVVLKPAGLAPPANSSQFAISLQPEPQWTGQFTVLGQVTEGLEIVRRISNVANTGRPNYKPIKDIHTVKISIEERGASPATASGS